MTSSASTHEDPANTGAPLVAVVGDAALDLSFDVTSFEGVDEKLAVTGCRRELGGTGANAAAAVVRLGGRARLHAVVGTDPIGGVLLEQLVKAGIDTAGVIVGQGRSTVAVILRSSGSRLVAVDRGVADDAIGLDPVAVSAEADVVYVSAMSWALTASVVAASAVPVVIGIEARQESELTAVGAAEAVARVLDQARVVVTNEAGEEALARPLRLLSRAALVITRGAKGARIRIGGQPSMDVAAPEVEVVDATGAGDCFAGTLCRFVAGGTPLEAAVRLATIAATMSTRHLGAQAGIPSEPEVRAWSERLVSQ